MRNSNIFVLSLYSNVFVHYECLFASYSIIFILAVLLILWEFSLVNLYLFEETCILVELPVYSEDNGICPNSVN